MGKKDKKAKGELKTIRSPICTVLGHVDHGKSSVLDKIRGTAIIDTEAGKITQAIGASIIPLYIIEKICGSLIANSGIKFTIPGLLFIDTPGHAAFTSLRKRGGNLADIAILVVDVNEGFKPQTIESIEILKQSKTPFIVAANKIDLLSGWKTQSEKLLDNISKQGQSVKELLDNRIYEIVGELSKLGFNSERFDRVSDYTKEIGIIPVSAMTGEGIPELLMTLAGLAQRFLEKCLECNTTGFAKGTILEVKEEKGLGTTLDVIIYDGMLNVNDIIVIGGVDNPIITKVKALLEPMPLMEMRDKKSKFRNVKNITAATGVKISAPEIQDVVAGMPLKSCSKDTLEQTKEDIQSQISDILIETGKRGVIIKADTLGSLEAMIKLFGESNIQIRKASVGDITKKDLMDAESNFEEDPITSIILGFNVKDASGICIEHVKIITSDIIYKIIEQFEEWKAEQLKKQEEAELARITRPCKIMVMKGYVFRQSNPAVFGVDVEAGTIKPGIQIMNQEGKLLSKVKSLQQEQDSVESAARGKQVAVAMDHITFGRQVNEGDVLYSAITEEEFKKLKEFKKLLSEEEIGVLKTIAEIMRKKNPVWGV